MNSILPRNPARALFPVLLAIVLTVSACAQVEGFSIVRAALARA